MKKISIFLVFVISSNLLFSQFYKRDFDNIELLWEMGESPLLTYKKALTQPLNFIAFKKYLKQEKIYRMLSAVVNRDSLAEAIEFTDNVSADFFYPEEYLYFDSLGNPVKAEYYLLDSGKIIKKISYISEGKPTLVINKYFLWDLSNSGTSLFKQETLYYKGNELINFQGRIPLGNYVYIDTSREENRTIRYLGFKSMEIEKRDSSNKVKLNIRFKRKNLVKRIRIIRYNYNSTGENEVIETYFKYKCNGNIKSIEEIEYLESAGTKNLIEKRVLEIKGDYDRLGNLKIYYNGDLAYERELTESYYLERNYLTGEYRYVLFWVDFFISQHIILMSYWDIGYKLYLRRMKRLLSRVPVYEISLHRVDKDNYILTRRAIRYSTSNIADW